MNKFVCMFAILIAGFSSPLLATVYFVDSQNGSDQASGISEGQAWRSLEKVNQADLKPGDVVRFARGGLWRGSLIPKSGAAGAPVTYTCYGPDELPKPRLYGSLPLNRPADWVKIETHFWRTTVPVVKPTSSLTYCDAGNLIFDGNRAGVKCWSKEQLKAEGDFWSDLETGHVWLFSNNNPAESCHEIEAALRRSHVVNLTGVHHVVISDFDVRYGASHGFGGSGNSNVTIRDCDISWIGGGHQFTRPDGVQVRYGNGIEFWADAHDHLVEGCRLWEIYDAALTNQGDGKNLQQNITYRNNIIWNCEYSFEYWNRDEESVTDNIVFTNNTCLNAGYGWGHKQRPDPNGRHLMFYETTAKTTNFVITKNVFAYATESILRVDSRRGREQTAEQSDAAQKSGEQGIDWVKHLIMNNNVWFRHPGDGSLLVLWQSEKINDFHIYREKSGLDRNSIIR